MNTYQVRDPSHILKYPSLTTQNHITI